MAEHDDAAVAHVCYHVLKALADLNVKEEEQRIDFRNIGRRLNGFNMQYTLDFVQRNVSHVKKLILFWNEVTMEAVEILRTYLTETTLNEIWLQGNLGNEKGARLLPGLHGNQSIKTLIIDRSGLDGAAGGGILSDLLLNNSTLDVLIFGRSPLGPEGARALQPGLHGNHTLELLALQGCNLGDEGLQAIAEAVTTVKVLDLCNNDITASGLPHVTRLLQRVSLLENIKLAKNPRLFDIEANTRNFSSALRNSTVKVLNLNYCELPGDVLTALLQAVSNNATIQHLYFFDRIPLPKPHIDRLLDIIPNMSNLVGLWINLNFMDESVLSSLNQNTSLWQLFNGEHPGASVRCVNDIVADIMERNYRLGLANELLNSESRRRVIPLGLWANGIASLFDDNRGATAVFHILHQKLPDWMSVANNTHTAALLRVPVAAAAIVVAPEDTDALDDTAITATTKTEIDWQQEINKLNEINACLRKELQESKMRLQHVITPQEAAAAAAAAPEESTTTAAAVASPVATAMSISNSSCTAKRSYAQAAMMGDDGDNNDDETSATDNGKPSKKRPVRS